MRWDTGGGLLGIVLLVAAGFYGAAFLFDFVEFIYGILWWSFG